MKLVAERTPHRTGKTVRAKGIIASALLLVYAVHRAEAQVTTNVFQRVLEVRVNGGTEHEATATAFTVDVDGREYLITAKHVVSGLKEDSTVDILTADKWISVPVKILRCDDPTDIAVLVPPRLLTGSFELPFEKQDFLLGQEVYFLGFPYGVQTPGQGANGLYPLALMKRGTLSAYIPQDQAKTPASKRPVLILLDGYNNPGFSGGPIVYRDLYEPQVMFRLLGVVSGFIPEVVPVMKKHEIKSPAEAGEAAKEQPWKIQQNPDKTYFEYVESGTYVPLNTGLLRGFTVDPAIDLIRRNPIGPEIKPSPGATPGTH